MIGANALLDGYSRDAIASFASALERYFEFALKVFVRQKQIKPSSSQATWRMMEKHSERQLGAFIAVWLMETGNTYGSVSQSQIEKRTKLRNEVIHQGKIPTPEECLEYGQYVIDVIAPIERVLLADYATAHKDECFALARNVSTKKPSAITVLSEFSVLSAALKDGANLRLALVRLRETRERNGIPSIGAEYFKSRRLTRVITP